MRKAEVGLIGLGVMGQNLARNWVANGYRVAIYSYATEEVEQFVSQYPEIGHQITACYSLQEFTEKLESPHKILLMVKAGDAVDRIIDDLSKYLSAGDILIDGGNSNYKDTNRRAATLANHSIEFVGTGISGGQEGALNGASIMPGGSTEAFERVQPYLECLSTRVDGLPCCTYIGPQGAGHFVKMVHNGIEYADMQLIADSYYLMSTLLKMPTAQIAQAFETWNKGNLNAYLTEITAKILRKKDEHTDSLLIDKILDKAGQKGTGIWTVIAALELGVPVPTLSAATFERAVSNKKELRGELADLYDSSSDYHAQASDYWLNKIENALYLAKIAVYAQGFSLLRKASETYDWNLNFTKIALIWRGGCIIRAGFLNKVSRSYQDDPSLKHLFLSAHLIDDIKAAVNDLRDVVSLGIQSGTSLPALTSVLSYFDSISSAELPANLIQAQRDFFGAHTYERVDQEGSFHTLWEQS